MSAPTTNVGLLDEIVTAYAENQIRGQQIQKMFLAIQARAPFMTLEQGPQVAECFAQLGVMAFTTKISEITGPYDVLLDLQASAKVGSEMLQMLIRVFVQCGWEVPS